MYNRVLVPIDGSEVAEAIVPFILEIAGPLDLDVIVLQVNRPIPPVVIEASGHVDFEDAEEHTVREIACRREAAEAAR